MYKRHRKLRTSAVMRNLVKDVYVSKEDLIYPIFLEEGANVKNEIESMPGIFRYSLESFKMQFDILRKIIRIF